jgi:hypothetical protein
VRRVGAILTVHGNVLLVPRATHRLLERINGDFTHSSADNDTSLRLRRAGGENPLAVGQAGTWAPSDVIADGHGPSLSLSMRRRFLHGRKGRPLGSQVRFLRRHGGPAWPIFSLPSAVRLLTGRSHASHGRGTVSRILAEAGP